MVVFDLIAVLLHLHLPTHGTLLGKKMPSYFDFHALSRREIMNGKKITNHMKQGTLLLTYFVHIIAIM